MKKKLTVHFANLTCELIPDNKRDFVLLKNEYKTLLTHTPSTYKIKMGSSSGNEFMLKKAKKDQCIYTYPQTKNKSDDNNYIFYGLEASIEYLALNKNVLFLHGSSFIKNGRAYIFCGPSGKGKSTIIHHVPSSNILSDDTAILKKIGKQFWVFTSPFDNKKRPGLQLQKAPVCKIFFLKPYHKTKWIKLELASGLKNILDNDLFYYYLLGGAKKMIINNKWGEKNTVLNTKSSVLRSSLKKLYKLAMDLTISSPLYKLYFTKDVSFLSDL